MKKVILGLSGGVDSSVSAYLLKKAGYDVTCAFMRNWDSALNNDYLGNPTVNDNVCPQEVDYQDALEVARELNLECLRIDFIEEYWNEVFTYFLNEYKKGRTPNPDIMCNKNIKFKAFLNFAMKQNADYIAMGHYAKVRHDENMSYLLRAHDNNKDQTYFLCMLSQAQLRKSLFPIGDIDKPEVRRIAHELNLKTKDKKDSTGICFIGERNFKQFLKNYLPAKPGNMVTLDGKVVAKHDGLMYYTIGQRKGLDIGGLKDFDNSPWFVIGKNLEKNELIVGQGYENEMLYSTSCTATDLNEISIPLVEDKIYQAKFRYRDKDHPVKVKKYDNHIEVIFQEPIRACTPGQAVVFYDNELCLGGAIIENAYYNGVKRQY